MTATPITLRVQKLDMSASSEKYRSTHSSVLDAQTQQVCCFSVRRGE